MSRRRPVLDTLLRVRKHARDARSREHEGSQRELGVARRAAEQRGHAARIGRDALERSGLRGTPAAVWRAVSAGAAVLQGSARVSRHAAEGAAAREVEARTQRIEAERAVAALERLAERRARAKRVHAVRKEQRRLDEIALRKRRVLVWIAIALVPVLGSASATLAETETRSETRVGAASLERLLSDIRTRAAELERRESELDERERGVSELERAVEDRIRELVTVTQRIEDRIDSWEESNGAKSISKLARIYGAMPPPQAAGLVEELDLELATAVLAKMKPKASAQLLPLLSEARALSISRFVGHPLGITPSLPEPEKP